MLCLADTACRPLKIGMKCVGLVLLGMTAEGGSVPPSFSVDLHALFPSVEHG